LGATTAVQSNAVSNTDLAGSCSYTIGLPFFDGLLGMGAEKQFPAMLIAPSSLYIQIRFAEIEQAVQVTMDPCRHIFGTYRDYVLNVGLNFYLKKYNGNYYMKMGLSVFFPSIFEIEVPLLEQIRITRILSGNGHGNIGNHTATTDTISARIATTGNTITLYTKAYR